MIVFFNRRLYLQFVRRRLLRQIVFASCSLIAIIFIIPADEAHAQTTLRKIEIVGTSRVTTDQVIELSGLKVGQVIDAGIVDAAANKLMQSGLFKKLGYRVGSTGQDATIVFEVEEAARNLPVVFENFVWFTDDELIRAIRKDVPFFDGTSPEGGSTADKISASLQRLVNQKSDGGHIQFLPYADLSTGKQVLLFTVKGISLPVCSLHFVGAQEITEAELIKNSQQLIKADYSRNDIAGFVHYQLFPLYRHLGHLRAQFGESTAAFEKAGPCTNGVSVTIPIDEGLRYSWQSSEWTGNQSLASSELTAALKMKSGDVADGLKIDQGLKDAKKAYGRKGYLTARIKESAAFDDASKNVTYQFAVTEGPQFHMGNLVVIGLPPADVEKIKEKWKLASGATFDAGYLNDFGPSNRELISQLKMRGSFKNSISTDMKPNEQTLSVDVILTFK